MKCFSLSLMLLLSIPRAHAWEVSIRLDEESKETVKLFSGDALEEIVEHLRSLKREYLPPSIARRLEAYPLTVLIERTTAAEGLFWPPGTRSIPSGMENELTISFAPSLLGNRDRLRLITHEFFHAVHFITHPKEDSWVREGLAQFFEYQVHGSYHADNVFLALSSSSTPLLSEFDVNHPIPEQYGNAFLYFLHLYSQCGTDRKNFVWQLLQTKGNGRDGINEFLKNGGKNPLCSNFRTHAEAFMVARAHNQYSGITQSDSFFIMDHVAKMEVNGHFEKEFRKLTPGQRMDFAHELPPYLPLVVSSGYFVGENLKNSFKDGQAKFFLLKTIPPFDVTELTPSGVQPKASVHAKVLIFKAF